MAYFALTEKLDVRACRGLVSASRGTEDCLIVDVQRHSSSPLPGQLVMFFLFCVLVLIVLLPCRSSLVR